MTRYRDAWRQYDLTTAKSAAPLAGAPVLTNLDPAGEAAEAFRNLALRVEGRLRGRSSSHIALLVTSPESGSGKTLTTLNLSLALTELVEGRILLVEADTANPALHRYLAIPPHSVASSDSHNAEGPPPFTPVPLIEGRLDVLPCSQLPSRGNVPSRAGLEALTEWARESYDIVLFDGPPLFASSGFQLAQAVDGVVIVVRAHVTRKRDFDRTCEELGPGKILGVILNDLDVSHPRSYPYRTRLRGKPPS